jgi:hypothetical protein
VEAIMYARIYNPPEPLRNEPLAQCFKRNVIRRLKKCYSVPIDFQIAWDPDTKIAPIVLCKGEHGLMNGLEQSVSDEIAYALVSFCEKRQIPIDDLDQALTFH